MENNNNIVKCPMCGSTEVHFDPINGAYKCDHCDSLFVTSSDAFMKNKIEEVTDRRNLMDFDEAMAILEQLSEKRPKNADIYFNKILCQYGVTYVNEDGLLTSKPTLSRANTTPVDSLDDYKKCLEYVDNKQIEIFYKSKLEEIETLRQKIIKKSEDIQDKYDVFICYKKTFVSDSGEKGGNTQDAKYAKDVYDILTSGELGRKYKTFIAEVSLKQYTGQDYEPVIYNALMSAKVMILIAASKVEFINSPWVKNEWSRFRALIDGEIQQTGQSSRILIPLICGSFLESNLPSKLKNQGLRKDDNDFKGILSESLNKYIRVGAFSGVKINTNNIGVKQIQTISINQGVQFGKIVGLEASEEGTLANAQSDMRANDLKHYKYAAKKIRTIVEKNPTNFQANLCLFFCLFGVNNIDALKEKDFNCVNLNELTTPLKNVLGSAPKESSGQIKEAINEIFINSLKDSCFSQLASNLVTESDCFLTFIGFLDPQTMQDYVKQLQGAFVQGIKNHPESIDGSNLLKISKEIFVKVYSNDSKNALDNIVSMYNDIGMTLKNLGKFDVALSFFAEVLKVNRYSSSALWNSFLCSLKVKTEGKIALKIKEKNYVVVNLSKEEEQKPNTSNLYCVLTDILKGGYPIEGANPDYFDCVKSVGISLLANKNTAFSILIFDSLIDIALNLTDAQFMCSLLDELGTCFLMTSNFKQAAKYFNESVSQNNYDTKAYIGLLKAHKHIKTNCSFVFYRGKLNENPDYKKALESSLKDDPNFKDQLSNFYNALESLKTTSRRNRNRTYRFFKKEETRCLKGMSDLSLVRVTKLIDGENIRREFVGKEQFTITNRNYKMKKKVIPVIFAWLIVGIQMVLTYFYSDFLALSAGLVLTLLFIFFFNKRRKLSDYGAEYDSYATFPLAIIAGGGLLACALFIPTFIPNLIYIQVKANNLAIYDTVLPKIISFIDISVYVSVGISLALLVLFYFRGHNNLGTILSPAIIVQGQILFNYLDNIFLNPDVVITLTIPTFSFMSFLKLAAMYLSMVIYDFGMMILAKKEGD